MSYFHETIWNGVPKFLRRVDTALRNIGINERVPYNAPLIQFSSWMGGDRDGMILFRMLFFTFQYIYTTPSQLLLYAKSAPSSLRDLVFSVFLKEEYT